MNQLNRNNKRKFRIRNCNIISAIRIESIDLPPISVSRRSFPFDRRDRFLSIDPPPPPRFHRRRYTLYFRLTMIPVVNWNPHCRLICDSLFTLSARGYRYDGICSIWGNGFAMIRFDERLKISINDRIHGFTTIFPRFWIIYWSSERQIYRNERYSVFARNYFSRERFNIYFDLINCVLLEKLGLIFARSPFHSQREIIRIILKYYLYLLYHLISTLKENVFELLYNKQVIITLYKQWFKQKLIYHIKKKKKKKILKARLFFTR